MIGLVFSADAPIIKGLDKESIDFTFDVVKTTTPDTIVKTTSGTSNLLMMPNVSWDLNYSYQVDRFLINKTNSQITGNQLSLSSSNPNVATVDQSGVLTYVADGSCTITATDVGLGASSKVISYTSSNYVFNISNLRYGDPTDLAAHIDQNVKELLTGYTPAQYNDTYFGIWKAININDYNNPIAVRNDKFGANLDLGWTGVARATSWNNSIGTGYPGHLISPRHIVSATHAGFTNGQQILFVDKNGKFTWASVIDHATIYGDADIAYLDKDVNIEPVMFPTETYSNYLPTQAVNVFNDLAAKYKAPYSATLSQSCAVDMPAIIIGYNPYSYAVNGNMSANTSAFFTEGKRHFIIVNCKGVSYNYMRGLPNEIVSEAQYGRPSSIYNQFNRDIYGGDSGSAQFFPIKVNGQMKCFFLMTLHSAFSGPDYSSLMYLIEQKMNQLAAAHGDTKTYQLNKYDLTAAGFKKYK